MPASIEHLIVSKIIEEADLAPAQKLGIKASHFAGDYGDVYQWILDHTAKNGKVPSEREFSSRYGHIDIEDASAETFTGLFDELMEAYKLRTISAAMTDAMAHIEKDDIQGGMAVLSKGLQSATTEGTKLRDFNIIEGWEERLAKYHYMQQHPDELLGIPTGFTGLDRLTQGFRDQQWIVMVGEQKRGKSLFELIMADACHVSGLTPLFVSYEMSVAEQLSRYYALKAHLPYDKLLSGNLTPKELERIERVMISAKNMHPFIMSEDSSGMTTISAVAAKLQQYRPAALYVDGVYLMDDENGEPKGSPQALTNISRGFKRLAQSFDIPIIGTTQVLSWKLGNKRTRAITADAIGYTSSFAQDADLIIGVERNPDIDSQAILRIVEARTAPRAEIHVQWNFRTMEFEEVDEGDSFDPAYD